MNIHGQTPFFYQYPEYNRGGTFSQEYLYFVQRGDSLELLAIYEWTEDVAEAWITPGGFERDNEKIQNGGVTQIVQGYQYKGEKDDCSGREIRSISTAVNRYCQVLFGKDAQATAGDIAALEAYLAPEKYRALAQNTALKAYLQEVRQGPSLYAPGYQSPLLAMNRLSARIEVYEKGDIAYYLVHETIPLDVDAGAAPHAEAAGLRDGLWIYDGYFLLAFQGTDAVIIDADVRPAFEVSELGDTG